MALSNAICYGPSFLISLYFKVAKMCIPRPPTTPESTEAPTEGEMNNTAKPENTCTGVATNSTLTEDGVACVFPFLDGLQAMLLFIF